MCGHLKYSHVAAAAPVTDDLTWRLTCVVYLNKAENNSGLQFRSRTFEIVCLGSFFMAYLWVADG